MSDPASFQQLITRHRGALARLCRHYEAQPEPRRDLEQEILLALWRAFATFRGECSERTFLYRVAHNVAATHVLRAVRQRALPEPEPPPPPSPEQTAEARDALALLERRLRSMDLTSRQLVLMALEGCSTAEMAEITGLSPTNITTRLSRARKALGEEQAG
ncbi:MAG: RNA polymerase sigma factor [Polyangiaceae bacterium]|nr:RNA polymerase sigma factor [Polyangiaceae bacterium]